MTLNDLQRTRKVVPHVIFAACLAPWFLAWFKSPAEADLTVKIIIPGAALLLAYFYVSLKLREPRWKQEMETHLGNQIRAVLLDMVPRDLDVTEDERCQLAREEVYKKLVGVFWEAVDRNEALRSHKEHFYSNGIVYSTSLDVFLICGFAGFCYAVCSLVLRDINLAYAASVLIAIALVSQLFAIPRARRQHIALSAEQLDLLRRKENDFVSQRFREIVLGWRRARAFR